MLSKIEKIEKELNNLNIDIKCIRALSSLFLEDLKKYDNFVFRVGKRDTKNTINSHITFINDKLVKLFVEKC